MAALCCAFGQSTPGPAAFEVASVKPNKSGNGSSRFNSGHGRLTATNVSLKSCIYFAYGIKDYQISGPEWLSSERYDITAKAASGVPDKQLMPMLQTLLQDRFKLRLHRQTKELPAYALVVGKGGPKLHEVETGPEQDNAGRGRLSARKISMPRLAEILSRHMDRPVLDMTGIKGVFDLTLDYAPDDAHSTMAPRGGGAGGIATDSPSGPSIFVALQEQLGLKLEARKGPVEILVIDYAEKVPTEN
jgi:uncharacterized protein (TIGR03435 family)